MFILCTKIILALVMSVILLFVLKWLISENERSFIKCIASDAIMLREPSVSPIGYNIR